ncbi:hypothetical protein HQ590_05080 [bacterium]|nr:hypothetical protein [bacterium]
MPIVLTDAEKQALWDAYHARRPTRVPLRWTVNPRIIVLNPSLNPAEWTFEQYVSDPQVNLAVRARFQEYVTTTLSQVSDLPAQLPDRWTAVADVGNTYDAAYFGGIVVCLPGQVPAVEPFLGLDDVDDFLRRDYSDVLANPFIKERFAFREQLVRAAKDFRCLDRRTDVAPVAFGSDGPVTAAAAIFGTDFFVLLGEDPERARRVLDKIVSDVLHRNHLLNRRCGRPERGPGIFFADDSIQLISPALYEQVVLPVHARYLDGMTTEDAAWGKRFMHLCGDATRHFKLIHDRLGVSSFDTGFPVDHGALRRELGPDVEISGGPHIARLEQGTPAQCAAEAKRILGSGIMDGGRFILQEGNNLPPGVPLENLAAVYAACQESGRYGSA